MAGVKGKGGKKGRSGGSRGPVRTIVKEQALVNPVVIEAGKMIPILPEESDYRFMTLQQIADHVNSIDDKRAVSKLTAFQMAVANIALGANIKDTEDLRKRFYCYCRLCEECDMRIGNMQAYAAMGITRHMASQWRNGGLGSTPERQELIREVDGICSGMREMLAASSKINPVLAIFWQKNFDGLRDVTEHTIAPGDPLGDRQTPQEIAEKYQDIIED